MQKMPSEFTIFLQRNQKQIDALAMTLISRFEDTILPEIHEIFGTELMMKFLDIFGGQLIRVPSRLQVKRAMRDVDIYLRLKQSQTRETLSYLATRYEKSRDELFNVFYKMRDEIGEAFEVLYGGEKLREVEDGSVRKGVDKKRDMQKK